MRMVWPLAGTYISILALTLALKVNAQEARPFEDVKPDHWAYTSVADLQSKGVITGYPDHHFDGQHTLTRYEFAVALKRAFDKISISHPETAPMGTAGQTGVADSAQPPEMAAAEVDELKRLTQLFKDELTSLGANLREIQLKLDDLSKTVAKHNRRADGGTRFNGELFVASRSERPHYGAFDYTGSGRDVNASLFGNISTSNDLQLGGRPDLIGGGRFSDRSGGFDIQARFGSITTSLFGGSSPQITTSSVLNTRRFDSGFDGLNFGDPATGQVVGFHGAVPLTRHGEVGVSLLNYSSVSVGGNAGGIGFGGLPSGSVATYGANFRINQIGRFALSGEAAKSVTQHIFDTGDDRNSDDNNAFLVNIGYKSGPLTATGGYQYYDPRYAAPGIWNKLGSLYNPTNVQGPFTRLGYRVSENLNANVGVDFLTGARNRPGFGGFTQGSSAFHGLASMRYHFSKQFELSAQYEGVLYDLSGAVSATGLRATPIEQYITFGAGLNLTGNTILRLAYQIINVQDASNGFGLSGGTSQGGASNTSVFTTQVAVHF